MKPRVACLLAFAAGHFALVVCGALSYRFLPVPSVPDAALRWYGTMTGADTSYGFFAPAVGSQARATFTLTDAAGRAWADTLDGDNQEITLRLGSLLSNSGNANLRPGLAASWAARMFGRHPRAEQVTVRIELYEVPSMEEYRTGARPAWETIYEATFRNDPKDGAS